MFEKKYIIIIGLIICLLVLYYFYDEISSVKKLFAPAYQKTMALEARLLNLEKKTNDPTPKRKTVNKVDSPALSITYQSDMVKNGNLSVKYTDLSDTEAKELLKKIDNVKTKPATIAHRPNTIIPIEELPEQKNIFIPNNKKTDFEDSETINVNIANLVRKETIAESAMNDSTEYEKILNGLTKNICSEDVFGDEIDEDIVNNISESLQFADMPSENTLSDIPSTPKIKKSYPVPKKNIKKTSFKKR